MEIKVKLGDQDQLFEKVGPQKLSSVLKEMGFNIKKAQIEMADIDAIGEYEAKIKFPHNLESTVKVIVAAEEEQV